MSHYELLCILSGKIAETDIAAVEKSIEELVKKNASTLHYAHHMDRKRLAYPIGRHTYGYYFVVEFDAEKTGTTLIEAELKLSADVLRHSLVTRTQVGTPPTSERKQSFDVLPSIGDIEQPTVHEPVVKAAVNEPVVARSIPEAPTEPMLKPMSNDATQETPQTKEVDKTEQPKEKKKQEKLSYEELDKKLDEIINNDLF